MAPVLSSLSQVGVSWRRPRRTGIGGFFWESTSGHVSVFSISLVQQWIQFLRQSSSAISHFSMCSQTSDPEVDSGGAALTVVRTTGRCYSRCLSCSCCSELKMVHTTEKCKFVVVWRVPSRLGTGIVRTTGRFALWGKAMCRFFGTESGTDNWKVQKFRRYSRWLQPKVVRTIGR